MKEEKFLPIGTIVMLKGGKKAVMINGFCAVAQEKPFKTFDYRGCPYPEGILNINGVVLFDHSQIEKVLHMGLKNDESIDFSDRLIMAIESVEGTSV